MSADRHRQTIDTGQGRENLGNAGDAGRHADLSDLVTIVIVELRVVGGQLGDRVVVLLKRERADCVADVHSIAEGLGL